ncbi:precorrin-6A/cobalt-precorrin-6A reductase [Larsenimonas salina]|uniref:precorrin-6A/cobalt-precorrin-6A reductase n=1 Tax=Larsenimonas salina TaxID=1295565 RepID=UPI002074A602|nr:precorrin-6A/cobalt-precorrin-6A reductase [Larsenimonas salina]MCM5703647.1 precorrin-6A/cobalt-precorrin-6A reductase [Larsenimonas salina]
MRALILGGTGDGRTLAERLSGHGLDVLYSVAGRLTSARLPTCATRVGGFSSSDHDSLEGLAETLIQESITLVIDATHPFAARISVTALAATKRLGLPCWQLRRPRWIPTSEDRWHEARDLEALVSSLEPYSRPFVTLGQSSLALVERLAPHQHALVRSAAALELPAPHRHVLDRGPFAIHKELDVMRGHHCDALVTKHSGGETTEAKLLAARALGLPVFLLARPPLPEADRVFYSPAALSRALIPGRPTDEVQHDR